jgi:hypothetical protein
VWLFVGIGLALALFVAVTAVVVSTRKSGISARGGPAAPADAGVEFPYGRALRNTDDPRDPAWPPEAGLVGQWQTYYEGPGDRRMLWKVECRRVGKWEVEGRCEDGLNTVGHFVGTDIKVSGATLTFTQKFDQGPPPWGNGACVVNGATVTARHEDRKLTLENGDTKTDPGDGNKVTTIIGGKTYRIHERKLLITWRGGEFSGTGKLAIFEGQAPTYYWVPRR